MINVEIFFKCLAEIKQLLCMDAFELGWLLMIFLTIYYDWRIT